MKILAIETSCDETAIAVVEAKGGLKNPKFNILADFVLSQIKTHSPFGGVVPSLAKRDHQKNLVVIFKKVLVEIGCLKIQNQKLKIKNTIKNLKLEKNRKILNSILAREPELLADLEKFLKKYEVLPRFDAIAVTAGPGLEPALWVGVNFARALSFIFDKPLIATNHIEGHVAANWLKPIGGNPKSLELIEEWERLPNPKLGFPALCLIVSGGHTQLILIKEFGKYKIIGETLDDAVGEAFDKVAKMLDLGYPGGPVVAALAATTRHKTQDTRYKINLPRPMMYSKNFDFSFSGLKTAVLYKVQEIKKTKRPDVGFAKSGSRLPVLQERRDLTLNIKRLICSEFQQACVDVLIHKTLKAAEKYKIKTVMIGGGVAANKELRNQLEKAVKEKLSGVYYHSVPLKFTGDNAAMIGAAAYVRIRNQESRPKIGGQARIRNTNLWKILKARANWRVDKK